MGVVGAFKGFDGAVERIKGVEGYQMGERTGGRGLSLPTSKCFPPPTRFIPPQTRLSHWQCCILSAPLSYADNVVGVSVYVDM